MKSVEAKAMIDKSSIIRHKVQSILNNGKVVPITAIGTDIATKYILGQVGNGNATAIMIVEALLSVSLHERLVDAFGDRVATEPERVAKEAVHMTTWQEARQHTKSAHHIFQDGCIARKLPTQSRRARPYCQSQG